MKTIEYKFQELCNEVDMWKEESLYWKSKYEESVKQHNADLDKEYKNTMNQFGSILTIAMNSEQTDKGLLIKQNIK